MGGRLIVQCNFVERLQELPGMALVRPPQFFHAFLHLFEMNKPFTAPEHRPAIEGTQSVSVPADPRGQKSAAATGGESGEVLVQSLHVFGLEEFPVADHVDDPVTDAGQSFWPL